MKNLFKLFGVIAMVVVIGFQFVACDGDDNGGDTPTGGKLTGGTVNAPTLASKTDTYIVITAPSAPSTGQAIEYGINTSNVAPSTWQSPQYNDIVFDSLTPETLYYIFARAKENETYNAGTPSSALQETTYASVPFTYGNYVGQNGIYISGYTGAGGALTIPSEIYGQTVTEIGDPSVSPLNPSGAFQEKQLTSVTIPDSVTKINVAAFAGNQLSSITIPNSVTHIGRYAFYSNPLTSVTIGADVNIGDSDSFPSNFTGAYFSGGSVAGTYTRPDTTSTAWTKQ